MDIFSVISLFGGLAFFLYGMKVMSGGLEKATNGKLHSSLTRLTGNRFVAMLCGAGMTIAVQSSSAVTVMLVGLVNSGVLEFGQTIGVLMGSNIGTTLTAWILSLAGIDSDVFWLNLLKPANFAPLFALAGIIMITGMAFGPGAGFLTGVVSAFVSNFIFGQGPWTPWQMFAYGVAGVLAGLFYKAKVMNELKKIRTAIFGYLIIQVIVGPLLDVCAIFTMGQPVDGAYALAIFGSGLVPNLIHGIATALTLFLLAKPMMEKLNRIKVKYGMMSKDADEWEDV